MSEPYHNKALPNGTILREWRLEQVLGVGGFGIVYRARGVYFNELVAIKEYFPGAISDRLDGITVCPTDSSAEEIYKLGLQKFVEEAKVLWNLSKPERHPNIVCVRSLFEIHGTAYMVMDFESGVSLSQMLKDGRQFDEHSLLNLIKPIAEGLDRAHRGGVLHRDIKPANILVDDTGRPVLIDFGSARFESGQATSTKVTFYTPPYAAIEQYVKTYPQGPWTDIYALGVVLYQCVTGTKPPEVLERLHGGLGEALSVHPRPGFSEKFTRAVDAAMAIRPSERPQSIPDWLMIFERKLEPADDDGRTRIAVTTAAVSPGPASLPVAADEPQPATAIVAARAWPSRKTLIAAGGGIAGLAIVVAALLLWPANREAAPPQPDTQVAELPAPEPQTAAPAPQIAIPSLDTAFDALLAKARDAGRPQAEIAKLRDARTKVVALTTQARSIATTPESAAKLPAALSAVNAAAIEASRGEADAISRDETRQWKDIQEPPDATGVPEVAKAITAVRDSKDRLDAAIAAVSNSKDAAASINSAIAALTAYVQFGSNYDAATRTYVSAKKQQFATQDASLRQVAARIIAFSGAEKPGFLASRARKDAYQQLQDNAAQARAQIARLDELSHSVSEASDLKQLATATLQAPDIEGSLSRLLTNSSADSDLLAR